MHWRSTVTSLISMVRPSRPASSLELGSQKGYLLLPARGAFGHARTAAYHEDSLVRGDGRLYFGKWFSFSRYHASLLSIPTRNTLFDRSSLLFRGGIGFIGNPSHEFPGKIIHRNRKRARRHYHLEAAVRQAYLSDQALCVVDPLSGPQIALPVAARPFRANHEVDLSGPGFEGLEKVQGLYSSAAWQGEELDPHTDLLLYRSSVGILFGIKLAAEEYRHMFFLIGYHFWPP